MKKLVFIVLVIFFAGCSSKVDNPDNKEEILKQIAQYKSEIVDLNKKISELEKDLNNLSGDKTGVAVEVQEIRTEYFRHFIEVTGVAEAVNSAFISPEINGQVKDVLVNEGEYVQKGEILVKLNSSVTENSIREVETSLELAKIVYKKQKELWDKNIGSEIEFLQAKNNVESLESRLETLKAQLDMAEIKAPISGIVDLISVKKGELAIPGQQIIQLVNLHEMYINADVSEAYITSVKPGETVFLKFPSFPDLNMEVPVYRLGNVIKEANRTFILQLKIANPNNLLKPNVLAKIKINDFSAENAVIIPSIIIKQDLQGKYVYTVDPGSQTARKVYIQTGRSYLDVSRVTSGLEPGDLVIVNGYNQVSNGIRVQILGSAADGQ